MGAPNPSSAAVAVSVGPVDAGSARAWLSQARVTVATIRRDGVVDVPDPVLAGFERLLDEWSTHADEARATGGVFHWSAEMDPRVIRELSSHWASIAAAARSGSVLQLPGEDAQPFYDALVTAVVVALADAEDHFDDAFVQAVPAFHDAIAPKVDRPIRVLVVDDTDDIRLLIRVMLANDPRLEVVGEARDGVEALQRAAELEVDAVLLDLMMPRMDGLTALPRLREAAPGSRIVVFSAADHRAADAMAAGADAFVVKSAAHDVIVDALLGAA